MRTNKINSFERSSLYNRSSMLPKIYNNELHGNPLYKPSARRCHLERCKYRTCLSFRLFNATRIISSSHDIRH